MANVGTSSTHLSEVGREGFPGETARATKASMAQGPVLFQVLTVRGIRVQGVLLDLTLS